MEAFEGIQQIGNTNSECTLIFLHGSGGGVDQLISTFLECSHPNLNHINILFPAAKPRPYLLNGGMPLPVWFDRDSVSTKCFEDQKGIAFTVQSVRDLARQEISRGVKKIYIGGFSQGGCASLYCGYPFLGAFTDEDNLFSGVICMSSFLCETALDRIPPSLDPKIPLLYTSNINDNVVPPRLSKRTFDRIHSAFPKNMLISNLNCDYSYHWLCDETVNMLFKFLNEISNSSTDQSQSI